jgi:hypothetical protein
MPHHRRLPTNLLLLLTPLGPQADRLNIVDPVSIARLLGEAAILLGRPDEARDCLEQVFELCQRWTTLSRWVCGPLSSARATSRGGLAQRPIPTQVV